MIEVMPYRRALVEATGKCQLCGEKRARLDCHEILNGGLRSTVLDEPSCLIVTCWDCNSGPLNRKGEMPLARQLAIIKVTSPDRYDREQVLQIRNPNAMQFVTEEEVDHWVKRDWKDGKFAQAK